MDAATFSAITGFVQAVLTLLVYFGVDAKVLGRPLMLTRSKTIAILILGSIAFSSYALYRTASEGSLEPSVQLFRVGEPCSWEIDGIHLMKFSEKYEVAGICGLIDYETDQLRDSRIAVSARFAIRPDKFKIAVQPSPAMTETLRKMAIQASEAVALPSPPAPAPMILKTITVGVWQYLILVPKNSDVATIRHLSDVQQQGGKIIRHDALRIQ